MAGPMMIDLGKRASKRALHAAESALSWQGWNSANPLHPKGPDGRWVKGHPFTRIIGDAPDHIHHLSDEDLASVDQSAESLLRAITAEKGRRGIGRIAQERGAADIPASRTYGTRPKEDFSVAGGSEEALATAYSRTRGLRERLANARTREEGHALLSDLEKKDLLQVAREMNIPGASALSKDNLRREMVEGSVGRRLDMIATRGFEGPLPGTGMTNDERTRRINELTAKIERVPPRSHLRQRLVRERAALSAEAMGVPNPAKPLRAARKPKTDIESVRANWEVAVNGPMPSDRERFRAELSGLTIKQLEELNGEKLPAGAKAQKINHMIEHRLGFRLNSETIRSTPLSRAETPEQIRIRQEMHAADLAGDRETYRRLHLERLNLRDEKPPAATSRPSTSAGDIETQRAHVASVQAPAFDITDAGHRQARINELTAKINDEEDPDFRAMWRKERAELATWKEPGSKRRPREPFRYENESARATQERHAVAQAAAGPAFEHDQKRAKETADQVRTLLKQARGSTGLKDEQVLEIVQGAKLNPRQMRLLADEFAVEFRPNNAFEKPLRTKAAREAYFASAVAGAHRRNPLGRTSVR